MRRYARNILSSKSSDDASAALAATPRPAAAVVTTTAVSNRLSFTIVSKAQGTIWCNAGGGRWKTRPEVRNRNVRDLR